MNSKTRIIKRAASLGHARVSVDDARRLLMDGAGLLAPSSKATTAGRVAGALGFIQLDTINTVERAHELILHARSDAYVRGGLFREFASKRRMFEHWTHDASVLPVEFLPQWRFRFERYKSSGWHLKRLGKGADGVIGRVLGRVRDEGPLMSRAFEGEGHKTAGWWNWKPAKAALEYLWRTGQLAVAGRENFQKVYDLPERVHPKALAMTTPSWEEHVDWACTGALDRLGVATPKEIAEFFAAVKVNDVRKWTDAALRDGRIVPVDVDGRLCVAPCDWKKRLARLPEPTTRIRLLAPFDPLIRDRARALRLFDFHYRFEAFVPEAKRVHGYYVLPILQGSRIVGRVDPKFDRKKGVLNVRLIGWEPKVRGTKAMLSELEAAVERLRGFVGAERFVLRK